MAVPSPATYQDQAVQAMKAVLGASTEFMAASALPGATGKVLRVDAYDAFVPRVATSGDVYCGVFLLGDQLGGTKTINRQERLTDVAVLVFGKTTVGQEQHQRTGRPVLWQDCARAASVVTKLVAQETHGGGGRFDGFAPIADVLKTEVEEDHDESKSQYSVTATSVVRMHVYLQIGA
jgi:hypothetical protein